MTLDFSASLYLGLQHPSRLLRPWSQLTTGAPAALAETAGSDSVALRLARLQGCQQATLARSTLHLVWDLFGILAAEPIAIYLDSGAYPTARWGVERAAARGAPVFTFRHRDAAALEQLLRQHTGRRRPVVVSDGLCNLCGCALPLAAYIECVRRVGGLLVIDDTQALGILGRRPKSAPPYGQGGGGSLTYCNTGGPEVLLISSLAKGFGAPLAALSGGSDPIRQFEANSQTRVHCSPPSAAAIQAAGRALALNAERGEAIRTALAQRVRQFRRGLAEAGLSTYGRWFPAQTLRLPPSVNVKQLHRDLDHRGVRTVLRRGHDGQPQISFILTARHRPEEVEAAIQALATTINYEALVPNEGG